VIIKQMARTLPDTLKEQQKWGLISWPYVKARIRRRWGDVIRYDYESLYSGEEDDYYHTAAMPSDGSLIRLRVTLPADVRKLYYQRITNPDGESDYSSWTYLEIDNVVRVASCAYGAKVAQFYVTSDRAIHWRESTDNGANWGAWAVLDYFPTTSIYGMSAAYKSNGDIGLFFADNITLYVKRRVSGAWQEQAAWDKSTGTLTGVTVFYDQDWNLTVTGILAAGGYGVATLIYGDGGLVPTGHWSDLQYIILRESTEHFTYTNPCARRDEE
ncbi:unnamed protein product, partial [marine sediment metagenome]